MSSFADSLLDIADGTLWYLSRTENEARFRAYLQSVRFLEWGDVIPPVINLSADRTLAVVAVEKRVRYLVEVGEQIIREGAARYAWIETWGWNDARRRLVGRAGGWTPARCRPWWALRGLGFSGIEQLIAM